MESDSARINRILIVIEAVSIACVLTGIGAIICGVLTLVFADPVMQFPYSTASGIWSGVVVLLQGVVGMILVKRYDKYNSSASAKWAAIFRSLSQGSVGVGVQHFGYSIAGVVFCATGATNKVGMKRCNPLERDNLIIVNSFGIAFGALMLIFGVGSILYLVIGRRAAYLIRDSKYGKCCLC